MASSDARHVRCLAARSTTTQRMRWKPVMKILLWIIGIIFLIGLLVVLGFGSLIF